MVYMPKRYKSIPDSPINEQMQEKYSHLNLIASLIIFEKDVYIMRDKEWAKHVFRYFKIDIGDDFKKVMDNNFYSLLRIKTFDGKTAPSRKHLVEALRYKGFNRKAIANYLEITEQAVNYELAKTRPLYHYFNHVFRILQNDYMTLFEIDMEERSIQIREQFFVTRKK